MRIATEEQSHINMDAIRTTDYLTTNVFSFFVNFLRAFVKEAHASHVISLVACFIDAFRPVAEREIYWTTDDCDYKENWFCLNSWNDCVLTVMCVLRPSLPRRSIAFSSPAVLDAFRSLTFTPIFRVLALYSIHLLAIDGYVSSLDRNRFSAIIHHEVAKHGFAYPYVTPRELCVFGVQLGVLFVSANWVFERCLRRFYSGLRLDSCPADAPTGLESMQLYLVQLLWNVLSARSCLAFDEEVRVAWWCEE